MLFFTLQDFLGLVEKLYYLSGKYEIQLTIGDASMVSTVLSDPMQLFSETLNNDILSSRRTLY